MLADDPGLGKTIQALAAISKVRCYPVLIFAPKAALGVWKNEIEECLGVKGKCIIYRGTPTKRHKLIPFLKNMLFVITTYGMAKEFVKINSTRATKVPWGCVVCDEYHLVGLLNHKTQCYKNIKEILVTSTPKDMTRFMGVSGTPSTKGPQDLFAVLHLCDPHNKAFRSYWRFVYTHCIVCENEFGYKEILSRPKSIEQFRRMIAPYFLRRRKKEVLRELPEKVRQLVSIEMSPRQKKIYRQLSEEMMLYFDSTGELVTAMNPAALIMKLRQVLVSPRMLTEDTDEDLGTGIQTLCEMVQQDFQEGNSVLIFTPFRKSVELITEAIKKAIPQCYVGNIMGALPNGLTPNDIAVEFQKERKVEKALVCTIKTGTSWTAHDANIVYFLGVEWTVHSNVQAEDRAHRFGQKKNVICKYIQYEDTVEEEIMRALIQKNMGIQSMFDPAEFAQKIKQRVHPGNM